MRVTHVPGSGLSITPPMDSLIPYTYSLSVPVHPFTYKSNSIGNTHKKTREFRTHCWYVNELHTAF